MEFGLDADIEFLRVEGQATLVNKDIGTIRVVCRGFEEVRNDACRTDGGE